MTKQDSLLATILTLSIEKLSRHEYSGFQREALIAMGTLFTMSLPRSTPNMLVIRFLIFGVLDPIKTLLYIQ